MSRLLPLVALLAPALACADATIAMPMPALCTSPRTVSAEFDLPETGDVTVVLNADAP